MAKPVRRVVTGHDAQGRAIIASDGVSARVFDQLGRSGLAFHEIWHTREMPARIDRFATEAPEERLMLAPPRNGVRIRVVDLPPETPETLAQVDAKAVFDAFGGGDALADRKTAPHPFMHRTETIDFGIVLEGEVTLIVDTGETLVRAGDIIVQRGTNHAWSNRSGRPCRIAFVLVDGKFEDGLQS